MKREKFLHEQQRFSIRKYSFGAASVLLGASLVFAGQALAEGQTMADILAGTNMVVEGFNAVSIVHTIASQKGIDMPITRALYQVLYEGLTPREGLEELMTREIKVESH